MSAEYSKDERTRAAKARRAYVDFTSSARAALAIGGAEYLDHRVSTNRGEIEVRYRVGLERLRCIVHEHTLQIIDSGICLTEHNDFDDNDDDDDYRAPEFASGTRGDTWLTLETLPGVVREARDAGKLVVYRRGD